VAAEQAGDTVLAQARGRLFGLSASRLGQAIAILLGELLALTGVVDRLGVAEKESSHGQPSRCYVGVVHQVSEDQEGFFDFYEREVLPSFR
jgi:hypothetical protein